MNGTPALLPPGPADGEAPAVAFARRDPRYLRGVVLVMLAGCFWSLAGLLIRNIEAASEWQILTVRSLTLAVTLVCVLTVRHRGRVVDEFRKVGAAGVIGGLGLGIGFTGFVFSLNHTTVANAVFILAASPFVTALLGRLMLGESVRRATWIAMTVALAGVTVMVVDGMRAGALFGNLAALAAVLGFAVFAVALRRGRDADMLPTVCLAGVFTTIVAGLLAEGVVMSLHDLALCAAMGVFELGVGLSLFVAGSRHVPAAELALLSLTEVVLGPLLVWIGVGEAPSALTLVGGAIVFSAITGQALSGMRRKSPPIGAV
ncbi:MAG: DMT family transporter [Alphaproteobacteria bacterium]